jgi:hypothetical protein
MSAQSFPASTFIPGYQQEELAIGARVVKGPLALPQTATGTLFTVTGGAILVTSLIGLVTTAIGATATSLSLGTAPTVGTAETAGIATSTAINSTVAGTLLSAPATPGVAGTTLTSPAVPATTVNATNNYHGTVAVAITANGAAITAVNVNGVQVGTTAGTYYVPAHGQISIAYTGGPPTWVWTASGALELSSTGSISIGKEHVVSPGTITWTTTASTTGAVTWYLNYIPLDNQPGIGVTAMVA